MVDDDRASPRTAGVIAPPLLIYAIPLAVGVLVHLWFAVRLLPAGLAPPVGMTLLVFGLIAVPAVLAFRRMNTSPKPWEPTTAVVTTGPYRFTRNPMYLGFTLLYLGTTCWVNTVWPLLLLPVVLVAMHYGVIVREEAYLERVFGEEYLRYKRRVRRWL